MRSLTALFFVGTIAFVYGLADEHAEIIQKLVMACMEETGVSQEGAMKGKEGIFDADPKMPEFLFCMFNKPGFVDDAGDYQIDTMKSILSDKIGADVAINLVNDCTGFEGDKLEKAVHLAKCFHEKKPDL